MESRLQVQVRHGEGAKHPKQAIESRSERNKQNNTLNFMDEFFFKNVHTKFIKFDSTNTILINFLKHNILILHMCTASSYLLLKKYPGIDTINPILHLKKQRLRVR